MQKALKLLLATILFFGYLLPEVSADEYNYNIFVSNFETGEIKNVLDKPIIIKFLKEYTSLSETGIKELFLLMKNDELTIKGLDILGEFYNTNLKTEYRTNLLNDARKDGYLTLKGLLKINELTDNGTLTKIGIRKFNNLVKDSSLFSVPKKVVSPPPLSYYVPIIGDGVGGESNSGGSDIGGVTDINGTAGRVGKTPAGSGIPSNPSGGGDSGTPLSVTGNPGNLQTLPGLPQPIIGSGALLPRLPAQRQVIGTGALQRLTPAVLPVNRPGLLQPATPGYFQPVNGTGALHRLNPVVLPVNRPVILQPQLLPVNPINNSNDEYINQKLKEINDCFITQYESHLKILDTTIEKFKEKIEKSKDEEEKEKYSLAIKKLEEIKRLYIVKYEFIKNY